MNMDTPDANTAKPILICDSVGEEIAEKPAKKQRKGKKYFFQTFFRKNPKFLHG